MLPSWLFVKRRGTTATEFLSLKLSSWTWKSHSYEPIKAIVLKGKETSSRKTNKAKNLQPSQNETPTSTPATGSQASLWVLPFCVLWVLCDPKFLLMPCHTRPAIIFSAVRLDQCLKSWGYWYLDKELTCGLSLLQLATRYGGKFCFPSTVRVRSTAPRVEKKQRASYPLHYSATFLRSRFMS